MKVTRNKKITENNPEKCTILLNKPRTIILMAKAVSYLLILALPPMKKYAKRQLTLLTFDFPLFLWLASYNESYIYIVVPFHRVLKNSPCIYNFIAF